MRPLMSPAWVGVAAAPRAARDHQADEGVAPTHQLRASTAGVGIIVAINAADGSACVS